MPATAACRYVRNVYSPASKNRMLMPGCTAFPCSGTVPISVSFPPSSWPETVHIPHSFAVCVLQFVMPVLLNVISLKISTARRVPKNVAGVPRNAVIWPRWAKGKVLIKFYFDTVGAF
jgi:hypothetical protein